MKKFLIKVALFFILAVIVDVTCGFFFENMRVRVRGGQTFKCEYIMKRCQDDILILGSSKAAHHYVPIIISDTLELTCYNGGQEGNGIIAAYARYKMVSARKKPKMVVYEVTPGYDYLQDNGYSGYLGALRQYTSNVDVRKEYLDFSDELERLRLLSNMYCNNSRMFTIVKDLLKPMPDYKGYEPLYGKIGNFSIVNRSVESRFRSIDSLKLSYFEKFISETRTDDVKLVMMISPTFGQVNIQDYEPAVELCKKYGVPLIDNSAYAGITGNNEFFQDRTHLNNNGALAYTKIVAHQIRNLITKSNL